MTYRFTVPPAYDGKKLLAFLRGGCKLSASLVRSVKYLDAGLLVDGVRAKTNYVLAAGQTVVVNLPGGDSGLPHSEQAVPVVYESDDVLVLGKPAGMATHPTRNQKEGTLANVYARMAAQNGYEPVFRPINRLDKNTSGLVLAAKSRYAAPLLANGVQKRYIAVCHGLLAQDEGEIDAPIGRAGDSIIRRVVRADGAPSVTRYRVLRRCADYTVLEVETLTGRTHQIRVHMAHIGHPLLGDTLYGGTGERIARHALHCTWMWFCEPVGGRRIETHSELPPDMAGLVSGDD